MTDTLKDLSDRLEQLGRKIHQKIDELDTQGVGHAATRQKALEMKIEHARLDALDKARRSGSTHPNQDATLAAEAEALKPTFEKWVAGIDKGF